MTLGEIVAINVRRVRMESGLTQEKLAHLAGVNRNYVGMIERRENSPTIDMIERLASALNVDAISLLSQDLRSG